VEKSNVTVFPQFHDPWIFMVCLLSPTFINCVGGCVHTSWGFLAGPTGAALTVSQPMEREFNPQKSAKLRCEGEVCGAFFGCCLMWDYL
jgi:hypothetical protein